MYIDIIHKSVYVDVFVGVCAQLDLDPVERDLDEAS